MAYFSKKDVQRLFEMFCRHFDRPSSLKLAQMACQAENDMINADQIAQMWIETAKAFGLSGQELIEYNGQVRNNFF